jgi:prophage regulatory protein
MKFLRLNQVMAMTGLSRSWIYLAIAENRFPKQVTLGGRSVAWVSEEIEKWMASRIELRDANENYRKAA